MNFKSNDILIHFRQLLKKDGKYTEILHGHCKPIVVIQDSPIFLIYILRCQMQYFEGAYIPCVQVHLHDDG